MANRIMSSFGMRVALALSLFATSARAGFDWGASLDFDVVVLANPYSSKAPEYTSSANRAEYVVGDVGLV